MASPLKKVLVSLIRRFVGSDQIELVKLFEIVVSDEAETRERIAQARADARLVHRQGKMINEGNCWVLIRPDDDREEPLNFLPADGAPILNQYFDVPASYAREAITNAAGALMPVGPVKIVIAVAYEENATFDDDLMIVVLDIEVPNSATARALLNRAEADERNIAHLGQAIEQGEVWVSMEEGTLEDCSPCFHRADAVDALAMYFGIPPDVSKKAMSRENLEKRYQDSLAEKERTVERDIDN